MRTRKYTPEERRRWNLNKFGLTVEDYETALKQQGGRCQICRKLPRKHRRLAVDHCHKRNVVRGLLCTWCNIGLGMFDDNIDLLERALSYLYGDR